MIGLLVGTVLSFSEKKSTIFTSSGVGYEVIPSLSLIAEMKKDKEISAKIHTIVREQEITLYGFSSDDEKTLFEKLISVSGIGPKTALGMISVPINQFMQSVENGDVAFLTKMPGIGKKTAERLIIELRGKIDLQSHAKNQINSQNIEEATEALQNLGYDKKSVTKILSNLENAQNLSAEELIKHFLSSYA